MLEEFNNWWGNGYVESGGRSWPSFGRYDTIEELVAAREGWSAALKWVLSIYSGFCNCGCHNDSTDNPAVLHRIKKELDNA